MTTKKEIEQEKEDVTKSLNFGLYELKTQVENLIISENISTDNTLTYLKKNERLIERAIDIVNKLFS